MVKEKAVYSSVECHYSMAAVAAVCWSSLAGMPLLLPDKTAASDGTVDRAARALFYQQKHRGRRNSSRSVLHRIYLLLFYG